MLLFVCVFFLFSVFCLFVFSLGILVDNRVVILIVKLGQYIILFTVKVVFIAL